MSFKKQRRCVDDILSRVSAAIFSVMTLPQLDKLVEHVRGTTTADEKKQKLSFQDTWFLNAVLDTNRPALLDRLVDHHRMVFCCPIEHIGGLEMLARLCEYKKTNHTCMRTYDLVKGTVPLLVTDHVTYLVDSLPNYVTQVAPLVLDHFSGPHLDVVLKRLFEHGFVPTATFLLDFCKRHVCHPKDASRLSELLDVCVAKSAPKSLLLHEFVDIAVSSPPSFWPVVERLDAWTSNPATRQASLARLAHYAARHPDLHRHLSSLLLQLADPLERDTASEILNSLLATTEDVDGLLPVLKTLFEQGANVMLDARVAPAAGRAHKEWNAWKLDRDASVP